jgi:hypothetical protein
MPGEIFKIRNFDRGELCENFRDPSGRGASNQWLAIVGGEGFINTYPDRNVPAHLRNVVSGNPIYPKLEGGGPVLKSVWVKGDLS